MNQAIERLRTGKTRLQDGEYDRRGGIDLAHPGVGQEPDHGVPGAQAAHQPALRRFKVVVVTDRKDLQAQLSATATLTGEAVEVATSRCRADAGAPQGAGLVFAMIQKYRDRMPPVSRA